MSPTSWSRTLADEPELMRRFWADAKRGKVFDASNPSTMVLAPCCGRRTPADTVIDCRAIPGTIVRGGNWQEEKDHDWLCDGCVHILYRDPAKGWPRWKLLEARGAPAAHVQEHRARHLAYQTQVADSRAGRPHEPERVLSESRVTVAREHLAAITAAVTTLEELNSNA